MNKNKEIQALQREQKQLKKEIKKIEKAIPIYLISFVFIMFLIVFYIEDKVYPFFNGIFNFIAFALCLIILLSFFLVSFQRKKIKEKQKLSKAIGSNLYRLMKLENE